MVNESNIPISKRSYIGAKKSKGCAQLPELQKYIETIIKASNECDSEDTSISDKNKFPKDRKFGRQTISRGNDHKMKQYQNRFDLNRRKSKTKPKTPLRCEAVSNGVEIFSKFVSEFEDPRNWKLDRTQNVGPSLRIENFLKKLYPNPYNLASVKEFKNSKTKFIFEKIEKDDLKDRALPDVVIFKVDAQNQVDFDKPDNIFDADTQVDIEKTDNIIENAEIEINPNERDNHTKDNAPALTSENCDQSPSQNDKANEDSKNSEVIDKVLDPIQKSFKNKSMNPASNISSWASSLESIGDMLCSESQMDLKKGKSFKVKNETTFGESFNKISESKFLNVDSEDLDKETSDCDIGKLKLLSISDSDESVSNINQVKEVEQAKDDVTDDFVTKKNSEISDDFTKNNELNDLFQIYNVMNKATESFLLISSKTEFMSSESDILPNLKEEKIAQLFEDLSKNARPPFSDKCKIEKKIKNSNATEVKTTKVEKHKNENSNLHNTLSKEELRLKKNSEEKSSDHAKSKPKDKKNPSKTEDSVENDNFSDKLDEKFKKEDLDTNQKIDEVLQFMYDCLIKFNSQEKLLHEREKHFLQENKKTMKKSTKNFSKEIMADSLKREKPSTSQLFKKKSYHQTIGKDSCESLSTKSLPNVKEIHSKYTAALSELNRKQNSKMQSKRRSESSAPNLPVAEKRIIKHSVSRQEIPVIESEAFPEFDLDTQSLPLPDSFEVRNVSYIQTVESQNELGGFAEETITVKRNSNNDLRVSKPILPLSVKIKRSTTNTCKTLKDFLETEEKLLAAEVTDGQLDFQKKAKERQKDFICMKSNHFLIKNKAISLENNFERPNSNFVICLNSFPRSLRTMTLRPRISSPLPLTISMSDVKTCDLKPLPYYSKYHLRKLSIPPETRHFVLRLSYKVKQGSIITMNKTAEAYIATPICIKAIVNLSRLREESFLKNSECHLKIKPIKKSLFVETNIPDTNKCYLKNALTLKSNVSDLLLTSGNGFNMKIDDEKPVEALLEALKEAEEKVFLLEKANDSVENLYRSSDSLNNYSESEILKSENEKRENDKKRVHDLLLRTYNLQQKLHGYLHKIPYMQPAILSCPLIQKESFLDFGVFIRDKSESNISLTELEINQEPNLPLVHWYLEPETCDKNSKADEATAVSVQMVDCGTSYNPPFEEETKTSDKQPHDLKYPSLSEKREIFPDDEDDRSSNYSFKSSNDFSESNDNQNTAKETADHSSHGELIEKLYNKIESFRQSFEEEKLKKQEKKDTKDLNEEDFNLKQLENMRENKMVEYDPKTTAKVLKTVFKGRKSSTELTIGLKDVPMTKVNNISVEKTKFSPNHTKISICISKEKSDELKQSSKINSQLLHNKFSSYYFDRLGPSLSTCQTEYSRLNDNTSKSSQSLNELNKESDEDEDDYKSVGSTAGDSDGDGIHEEKPNSKEQTTVELPQPKSFTKHRFDFYRKMDLNKEENRARQTSLTNTWSRYKELEPLKQALTEMQIRMRSIKRDAILNSNDYYERALKLAKMSAGFCQSCGTRAVIPDDTFGFYKTLLPRRCTHSHRNRHIRTALTPNSSFYSFRSSNAEVKDRYCDLNIKHNSSYLLNRTTHVRSSLHDMPILFERM